jgi:hypothetical protein
MLQQQSPARKSTHCAIVNGIREQDGQHYGMAACWAKKRTKKQGKVKPIIISLITLSTKFLLCLF